jgi:hypothetical protein
MRDGGRELQFFNLRGKFPRGGDEFFAGGGQFQARFKI